MIRKIFTLAICILTTILTVSAQTPPDNEIWYTTTDGKKVELYYLVDDVASHTYVNGKGVIKFNNSVTGLGWGALRDCTNLKSITIPDSVTMIGKGAFSGCNSLISINIPNGVTLFGDYAFSGCNSLTRINIPNGVTQIGDYAFSGCKSLKSFKGKYASADGRCLIKDGVLFAFAPSGLTSYTIPYGVTEIEYDVFCECTNLKRITIPDSVTVIGYEAFFGCTSLASINIPNSVTEIRSSAFSGCTSLTNITIPDSVTLIGGYGESGGCAFSGCTSLTNITISNSVTEIWDNTFSDCTSLTSINIPDSVTKIGYEAFAGCTSLTSINIPDSVTEIGRDAFSDCTSLPIINKIRYADTYLVEPVDKSLTSYTIKAGTRFIGYGAFNGCTSLTSITIPDSVTQIGYGAFEGCTSLTNITIPDSVTEIRWGAFEGCTSLTSINIPNSVTEIGRNAFSGCTSLTSITISDNVTEIGYEAFKNCTNLTSITIPDSVTEIDGYAFSDCTSLTSITIPDSVTEIGDYAFSGCNIEQITISAVTGNIFRGYDGLDPSKVVAYTGKYASEDGRCLIKDGVLIDIIHTGLTSYVIPENITTIGKGVFKGCSTLKEITIPNSVTMIGEGAFEGCNIERITINAVTGNIFRGRNGLDPSKVVAYTGKYASEDGRCLIKDGVLIDYIHNGAERYEIPNGVTIISDGVFRGCSSLTSITCLATTPPQISTLGIGEEIVIYVPKEAVKLYKKAEGWEVYKKQIKRIKE